jgi:sporulation protein YlmC with PRC-barrel domain
MESTSELREITALIEHEVYSASGTFVGQVEDLKLDLDAEAVTGLALGRINDEMFEEYAADERGIIVPYRWVRSVGDIVIVNDTIERFDESGNDESVVE